MRLLGYGRQYLGHALWYFQQEEQLGSDKWSRDRGYQGKGIDKGVTSLQGKTSAD